MKRIVKNPEERKKELVEAAERLFMNIGYEQTAVSDIVNEVNVSQGAFYYYFKSKEDVLVAVLEKNLSAMEEDFRQIAGRSDLDEAVKLNYMFNRFIKNGITGRKILGFIHQSKDANLHTKMSKMRPFSKVAPIMAGVISRGIEKGRFKVGYPVETSHILLMLLGTFLFTMNLEMAGDSESEGRRENMRMALEDQLARALGVNDYRFFLQI
jgi:AcrR family transcriptional regulator